MEKITSQKISGVRGSFWEHRGGVGALKTEQAATYLGIKRTTLYHLVRDGKIPFTEVGSAKLYRISDLDEFLRPKGTIEKLMQPLVEAIKKEYFHGRK